MASFNGRRAPNVSQYIANLNTIPDAQDLSQDLSLPDGSLDFLTNTEFFDFDQFNPTAGFEQSASSQQPVSQTGPAKDGGFQYSEFSAFDPNSIISPALSPDLHGLPNTFPTPSHFATSPTTGEKRKASIALVGSSTDLEETSRLAAEEDKRRRNTAASARFRVKKKQREQALEKQAKEMTDKVSQLESKIQQLEMENKWLKGLITEKRDAKVKDHAGAVAAAAAARKAEKAEKSEKAAAAAGDDRIADNRTDGVGTDDEDAAGERSSVSGDASE